MKHTKLLIKLMDSGELRGVDKQGRGRRAKPCHSVGREIQQVPPLANQGTNLLSVQGGSQSCALGAPEPEKRIFGHSVGLPLLSTCLFLPTLYLSFPLPISLVCDYAVQCIALRRFTLKPLHYPFARVAMQGWGGGEGQRSPWSHPRIS